MKLKKGFVTHMVYDTQMMVAVGKASKVFQGLVRSNETAAFIVNCLKSETSEAEIVEKLLAEYDAPREAVARDVHGIIEKLNSIGALE